MDTTTLNIEYLRHLGLNEDRIDFIDRNGLCSFPVVRLGEIEGDYITTFNCIRLLLKTKKVYDENGNMIHVVDSDGNEFRYEYDSNGNKIRVVDSDGRESRYEYDENGHKILIVYPSGREYRYEYDENGNKIRQVFPDGNETRWTTEYYSTGQLKRYNELRIPRI
jgi:YD repeat-containing protein